jgi:hypothetical protein
MVVHDFGSSMSLVWIIGSSLLVNSFILYGATIIVLYGTTTPVLCETHRPLWLPFCLFGWFDLWLDFGLSSDDNLDQGCETTIWVVWFIWQPSISSSLMN